MEFLVGEWHTGWYGEDGPVELSARGRLVYMSAPCLHQNCFVPVRVVGRTVVHYRGESTYLLVMELLITLEVFLQTNH